MGRVQRHHELRQLGADADYAQSVDDLRNAFRYGRGGQSAGTVTVDDNFDPGRYLYRGSGTALSRGGVKRQRTYDGLGRLVHETGSGAEAATTDRTSPTTSPAG